MNNHRHVLADTSRRPAGGSARFRHRGYCLALVMGLMSATVGCGAKEHIREDRATLSGTVTFDGAPLPAGTITFRSKDDPLIQHSTSIGEGGSYSTSNAPIGEVLVTVDTLSIQFGNAAAYVPIPDRYREARTSGLTATIKPGNNENVDFSLTK